MSPLLLITYPHTIDDTPGWCVEVHQPEPPADPVPFDGIWNVCWHRDRAAAEAIGLMFAATIAGGLALSDSCDESRAELVELADDDVAGRLGLARRRGDALIADPAMVVRIDYDEEREPVADWHQQVRTVLAMGVLK